MMRWNHSIAILSTWCWDWWTYSYEAASQFTDDGGSLPGVLREESCHANWEVVERGEHAERLPRRCCYNCRRVTSRVSSQTWWRIGDLWKQWSPQECWYLHFHVDPSGASCDDTDISWDHVDVSCDHAAVSCDHVDVSCDYVNVSYDIAGLTTQYLPLAARDSKTGPDMHLQYILHLLQLSLNGWVLENGHKYTIPTYREY